MLPKHAPRRIASLILGGAFVAGLVFLVSLAPKSHPSQASSHFRAKHRYLLSQEAKEFGFELVQYDPFSRPFVESKTADPDPDFVHMGKHWMRFIDDEKLLSEISIPGTHDSGSRNPTKDLKIKNVKAFTNLKK